MLTLYELTHECPYCAASIRLLLDCSVAEQSYFEDCEVCCCPIYIHYRVDENDEPFELQLSKDDDA